MSYKKVLKCNTAGAIAIPSKQSYGEWTFDVYKGADGNSYNIEICAQDKNGTSLANAYEVNLFTNEVIRFTRRVAGGFNSLFMTTSSYISNNTWYTIKVARLQSEGVFKDIPTLQVSNMVNGNYTSFTSNGRFGFRAVSDGSNNMEAGTADEILIVNGAKYLVEFDLKLNSGTAPTLEFRNGQTGSSHSNFVTPVNGQNSIILTATSTTTGVLEFFNTTATNYEVSGLTIKRIYPANTFAVFIKGGAYGNTETGWTLVDTTGGSGTNPVTDSTYTTSEYFVADLDAGDRLANIKVMDGVKQ